MTDPWPEDGAELREHARREARNEWLSGAPMADLVTARGRWSNPADVAALEAMVEYRRLNPDR